MAFSWGPRSVSTRFCAKEATSTPEPALSEVMSFCALALLAAATDAAELARALDVDELNAVVAMAYFLNSIDVSDECLLT